MEKTASVQALLEQLRKEYLADLPSRLNEIENLILNLGAKNYEDLYRHIHSLKGSAGTHGLQIISTICHHLEDSLSHLDENEALADKNSKKTCLEYVDLLKLAVKSIISGKDNFELFEARLHKINKQLIEVEEIKILLAEKSKLYCDMITEALGNLPVRIKTQHNGFTALEHLLINHFDILITARELPMLNGEALIAANKLSHGVNRSIYTVLLTTQEITTKNSDIEADCIIKRNTQMSGTLQEIIGEQVKSKK